ncbi:MAG: DNA alkylation repair protein [Candidatus Omnitrophota bacterium]|nr:DNA alkylation repair protein [Candidatus Omnitrophota bacterium]
MRITQKIKQELRSYARPEKARILARFFKTGPGEYAEGDVFIGVMVPQIRMVVNEYCDVPLESVKRLLTSKIHEERLCALLILVKQYKNAGEQGKKDVYELYCTHTRFINNWDLIDLTAKHIVGAFLFDKDKKPLYVLARSKMLWERRIAILATFHCIERKEFDDAFALALLLLSDTHDLIQKAVGWMLREIGKRDMRAEEVFLKKYYRIMPRTMLRYAIERFPERKRQAYLKGRA